MTENFLQLRNLTKRYSTAKPAVDGVSLSIPTGSIYGLLGPNGAGKTSLIRMITCITGPDSGEILIKGKSLTPEDVVRIGYMPEERGLYKKMKVFEQLVYLLRLKGLARKEAENKVKSWLDRLNIQDWAGKEIRELSKGMQQKVQFIATVAHEPELLILDEPFSGLDPINTQLIEDEIRALSAKGTTIIFSTHRMEQVEELCDKIALINQGKVLLEDSLQQARESFVKNIFSFRFYGDGEELRKIPGGKILEMTPTEALIEFPEGTDRRQLFREISKLDLEIIRFELHLPRLQEIFIQLVKGSPAHA
ncbi:MAG: ATP-binding cassette domain-containing protein [Bacteroidia bacterium]|nr:ATP-binding cassette domain-containing protein [Bacteroidia bacterium]